MIPDYQSKPAKRLTYKERAKAGLVSPKKRAKLPKVAARKVGDQKRYIDWIRIAMHGIARCERCKKHIGTCGQLEPHHVHGRQGANLFVVVPLCSPCHDGIHAAPSKAYQEGWLTHLYRKVKEDPLLPKPWEGKTLPPP